MSLYLPLSLHRDSSIQIVDRYKAIQLGDGYQHRQAEGINSQRMKLSVVVVSTTNAERDAMIAFLNEVGSIEPFFMKPAPNYALQQFIINGGYNESSLGGGVYRYEFEAETYNAAPQISAISPNGASILRVN